MPKREDVTLHFHITEMFYVYLYINRVHPSIFYRKCLCEFEVLTEVYFPMN